MPRAFTDALPPLNRGLTSCLALPSGSLELILEYLKHFFAVVPNQRSTQTVLFVVPGYIGQVGKLAAGNRTRRCYFLSLVVIGARKKRSILMSLAVVALF